MSGCFNSETKIKINELLMDVAEHINDDESFTNDFRDFTKEAIVIVKLCMTYEEGSGKIITQENMHDKKGVIPFIKDCIPLLEQLIGNKIKITNLMIINIVKFYPVLREKLNEPNVC